MKLTDYEADILLALDKRKARSQRELSERTGYAVGTVNKALKMLQEKELIEMKASSISLNEKAESLLKKNSPENAVILAAGFGMRMVPINFEMPKALLDVNGEKLIERVIRQLHEAGIYEIHIVVGFMKEKFEYLIDKYGVDLIVNANYGSTNTLASLSLAEKYLRNTYIIPSDIWCKTNPFSSSELYSWYMVSDEFNEESDVRMNRRRQLKRVNQKPGNQMIGISYICQDDTLRLKERMKVLAEKEQSENMFWEEALYGDDSDRMFIAGKMVPAGNCIEINTYEQLRQLDDKSASLQSNAMNTIGKVFKVEQKEIVNITVLKKGMTNRSFCFSIAGKGKYIMRIPGEGTDKLIDRKHEADVYQAISGKGLCDDPVYMNPDNGYKITKFLDGVRNCDPLNEGDLVRVMDKLRAFHQMKLEVNHDFDIFRQISFYQSLWDDEPSMYDDHEKTTKHVFELKEYIDKQPHDWCLTHIDAVPDNFLFYKNEEGKEELQLTDWEYAGMQDPHVDIAMFCIYSLYDKKQVDHLIDLYFQGNCPEDVRTKIYCYIASCGLLWSNWCEYKSHLGVEFGEYSLRQYRFAKDYYRYAKERIRV